MFRKHFSDEVLLALLDGELTRTRTRAAQAHLRVCWQCRARHAALESQAERIATAYTRTVALDSGRTRLARLKFHAWANEAEAPNFFSPGGPRLWYRTIALAAALVVCVAVGGFIALRTPAPAPAPTPDIRKLAALAEHAESQSAKDAVHQVFYAEIIASDPARPRVGGPLEIWSDVQQQRYACRWRLDDGTLRYARWQPDAASHFRFDRVTARTERVGDARNRPLAIYDLQPAGEDLDVLFMRWLENRRVQPVMLVREFLEYAARGGVTLRMERVRSPGGPDVFRLAGFRQTAHLRMEVAVELAVDNYTPRFLRVRFENGGRSVEIHLTVQSNERVPPIHLASAVFAPDRPLVPPLAPKSTIAAVIARAPALGPATLNEVEIEAYYALHQMGACKGDAVELRRVDNRIVVEGVVATAERKQQLLAGLGGIVPAEALSTQLQAASEIDLSGGAPPGASGTAARLVGHGPARLKAEIELDAYLAAHPATFGAPDASALTGIANQALNVEGDLMDDAWALRQLAARYGNAPGPALSAHALTLLRTMVRDHAASLRGSTSRLGEVLAPVTVLMAVRPPAPAVNPLADDPRDWARQCEQLYRAAQRIKTITEFLFAGGGVYTERNERAFTAGPPMQDSGISLRDFPAALSVLDADALPLLGRRETPSAEAQPQPAK